MTTSTKDPRSSLRTAPRKYSMQKEITRAITKGDSALTSITLVLTTKTTNATQDANIKCMTLVIKRILMSSKRSKMAKVKSLGTKLLGRWMARKNVKLFSTRTTAYLT